jgi:hypothetical protein
MQIARFLAAGQTRALQRDDSTLEPRETRFKDPLVRAERARPSYQEGNSLTAMSWPPTSIHLFGCFG